jgi:hypothetical protein
MKKRGHNTNRSNLNKDNIIKPTLDHLSKEHYKALMAHHKDVDEIFLWRYEVTRRGLIQKDAALINLRKSKVTSEVWSNISLSLNDVQVMINSALERQAESSNEIMCRLVEERDRKKLADSNVHASTSSCTINFAQINSQPSGTSAGGTSEPCK